MSLPDDSKTTKNIFRIYCVISYLFTLSKYYWPLCIEVFYLYRTAFFAMLFYRFVAYVFVMIFLAFIIPFVYHSRSRSGCTSITEHHSTEADVLKLNR